MMTDKITNEQDIITSYDIIARLEELSRVRRALIRGGDKAALRTWNSTCKAEFDMLVSVREQAMAYSDWPYGMDFVRDSFLADYLEMLSHDTDIIPEGIPSWIEIDWKKTAENVRGWYDMIDFDGVTYLTRSH